MAEPITVEFELGADEVTQELGLRSERRNSLYTAALMIVAAGVCLAFYLQGDRPKMWMPAALLGLYALVMLFYVFVHLPRRIRADAARLAGTARVKFADDGIRYGGAGTAKGYSWGKVSSVLDRPSAWVITAGKKSEGFVIPKQAVPADQAEQFASSLREWSGKAYKQRKR
ncbi:MAG TPA: YcxB family protein [Actinospica sp.]|nr:YcxB family protein [Actinospica sp.]